MAIIGCPPRLLGSVYNEPEGAPNTSKKNKTIFLLLNQLIQ